ncbi:Deoxycytidine triphosphate deaminase [Novipirellula aureliae]|uniref:Deoxycytidine triphosphate deaminase n=1 Tax=Novipirellula aureliae TaxID=2527966 RepID=A0A5C6E365_9BACT|nr:dCTP deaminase [Novipirellula aureliae]TWU42944.1 Deoxycytidine triphosphate deaminase [Novipirellula aureliae]
MLISGEEIQRRMGLDLNIDPFDPLRVNPNSYDLSLHHELLVYEEIVLDAASPNRYRRIEIPPEGLTLQPGLLYLGRTVEFTETHSLVPMIQGRSSFARLGLMVNPGGSLGDIGYCGTWTLDLHCVQPIRIYPNMKVCQIYYLDLLNPGATYCSKKYQNSRDIQPSLIFRELGGDNRDEQMELNFDEILHGSRS